MTHLEIAANARKPYADSISVMSKRIAELESALTDCVDALQIVMPGTWPLEKSHAILNSKGKS